MTEEFEEILEVVSNRRYSNIEHVAVHSLIELIRFDNAAFLFLKDDKVKQFWDQKVKSAQTIINKRNEEITTYNIKKNAYDRLSVDDRKNIEIN
jgi:hypothetical protein